ncbi:peptide chain release factor 2 [bacterium 3DAC]|nr:peptide chain release factor 2 [Dictyoglomota bacterium]UZN23225.1 peptide chain release factor 2 [bacterium 3DAC]
MVFDLAKVKSDIEELKKQTSAPDLWDDPQRASSLMKTLQEKENILKEIEDLENQFADIEAYFELHEETGDEELLQELSQAVEDLERAVESFWVKTLFTGKYDDKDAVLSLHAGAGGVEAMDWTSMLMRMYMRWAEENGYSVEVLDVSEGEEAGVKSATMVIKGPYAYGKLKAEKGVHRLVRISPFDANKRRHTSFAQVEVVPYFDEDVDIDINPEDIRMDTFRSGGKGGQHQNKRESGVRLTHIPTGISVIVTSERSQHQNRAKAMKILKARLLQHYEKQREEELRKLKGEHKSAEWGNQIRSYVMQPYQMVKDHRTGYEVGNVGAVLDGDIDEFIIAYLKWSAGKDDGSGK